MEQKFGKGFLERNVFFSLVAILSHEKIFNLRPKWVISEECDASRWSLSLNPVKTWIFYALFFLQLLIHQRELFLCWIFTCGSNTRKHISFSILSWSITIVTLSINQHLHMFYWCLFKHRRQKTLKSSTLITATKTVKRYVLKLTDL